MTGKVELDKLRLLAKSNSYIVLTKTNKQINTHQNTRQNENASKRKKAPKTLHNLPNATE